MNHNDNPLPPLQLNAAQTTLLENIMAALGRSPAYAHAPTMRQLMAYPYAATDAALPEAQRLQSAAESALRELRMAQMGWSMLGVCTLKTLAAEVKDLEKAHPEWAVRPANSSAPPPRTAAPAVPVMEVKAERPSQSSPRPNAAANRRAPLFRQITPDERRANLIVLLACVLTVGSILAASAVAYFGFGAANVAKDIAVGAGTVATLQLVRVARRWHRRFAVRFNLCRLALCLALLFSSAAYHAARGIVKGICLLASNDHLYAPLRHLRHGALHLGGLSAEMRRQPSPLRAFPSGTLARLGHRFAPDAGGRLFLEHGHSKMRKSHGDLSRRVFKNQKKLCTILSQITWPLRRCP